MMLHDGKILWFLVESGEGMLIVNDKQLRFYYGAAGNNIYVSGEHVRVHLRYYEGIPYVEQIYKENKGVS